MNRGSGVTVTARGVATLSGQQPPTLAVAWASAWVGGGAQALSTHSETNTIVSSVSFLRVMLSLATFDILYSLEIEGIRGVLIVQPSCESFCTRRRRPRV